MTDEQIAKIKFRSISHIAMSDYHFTQYEATNVPFQFNIEVSVPTSSFSFDWEEPEDGKKRRSSKRYCLQGKYYRSKKKLYEALHQIECNI